jgi:hypothetical protein
VAVTADWVRQLRGDEESDFGDALVDAFDRIVMSATIRRADDGRH